MYVNKGYFRSPVEVETLNVTLNATGEEDVTSMPYWDQLIQEQSECMLLDRAQFSHYLTIIPVGFPVFKTLVLFHIFNKHQVNG